MAQSLLYRKGIKTYKKNIAEKTGKIGKKQKYIK